MVKLAEACLVLQFFRPQDPPGHHRAQMQGTLYDPEGQELWFALSSSSGYVFIPFVYIPAIITQRPACFHMAWTCMPKSFFSVCMFETSPDMLQSSRACMFFIKGIRLFDIAQLPGVEERWAVLGEAWSHRPLQMHGSQPSTRKCFSLQTYDTKMLPCSQCRKYKQPCIAPDLVPCAWFQVVGSSSVKRGGKKLFRFEISHEECEFQAHICILLCQVTVQNCTCIHAYTSPWIWSSAWYGYAIRSHSNLAEDDVDITEMNLMNILMRLYKSCCMCSYSCEIKRPQHTKHAYIHTYVLSCMH